MNNISLKPTNIPYRVIPIIQIDDKHISPKKNEFGNLICTHSTNAEEVTVTISTFLELSGKLWWLYALITFIVSIFGFFSPPYDKKCITVEGQFKIKLNSSDTKIDIIFNQFKDQSPAYSINSNTEFIETTNKYIIDKKAKKSQKILLVTKILSWVILAILLAVFLPKAF